jgi:hypothetical protein
MRKLVLIFGPIEVSIPIRLALAATLKAGQDRWCGALHRVCGAVESLTLARPTPPGFTA